MIKQKFRLIRLVYKLVIKQLLFLFPPELVHNLILRVGHILGGTSIGRAITRGLFYYENDLLAINLKGVNFPNPIGLAAGLDKDADLVSVIPEVGFGHMEIGSVTLYPYQGNPKPRLKRLKKSKSIWVNIGLKNIGTEKVLLKLKQRAIPNFTYGVSVAKTNSPENCVDEKAIMDYSQSFEMAVKAPSVKYVTVNISCPNAFGGEPFTSVEKLKSLLSELDKIEHQKLVFIKMPISIDDEAFLQMLAEICNHKVDGIVIGNLQKDKTLAVEDTSQLKGGGLSGKPTFERSNYLIAQAYKNFGERLIIVGCGGIFTAEDAYCKIKLGASLLQLATGLIFEGPSVVSDIKIGLVELLKRDGYTAIEQTIGIDAI